MRPVAHAVDRGADAVGADGERQQQAGEAEAGHQRLAPAGIVRRARRTQAFWFSLGGAVLYFEGHFVISELRSPTKRAALLLDGHDHLAAFAEGSGTVPV